MARARAAAPLALALAHWLLVAASAAPNSLPNLDGMWAGHAAAIGLGLGTTFVMINEAGSAGVYAEIGGLLQAS